jgi:hypothetical protein
MTTNDKDPIRSWNDRIANLRQGGATTLTIAPVEIDARFERPPPPDRLSEREKELWRKLVDSRRPGWFRGGEELLESYVLTTMQTQQIEAELRLRKPSSEPDYQRLARLHRQCVAQTSLLATRLRLTPGSRIDKSQPQVGEVPMA